jgi:ribonuclease Z
MRLSHVFVTHTHMDHFCGSGHLLRVMLGRKAGIVVGGPTFLAQIEHKLRAYTWNVVHRYEVELVIDAREMGVGRGRQRALFSSRRRFAREAGASLEQSDDVVHDEATFRVRGRFVDHDIPCLAHVIEEKARVKFAKDQLKAMGVSAGAWLRELNMRY